MDYYKQVLQKYAVFEGRARRKEYWMFFLGNAIFGFVLGILDYAFGLQSAHGIGLLSCLYAVAVFVPTFAVTVRRLHDTNHSGWWLIIFLLPVIGSIVILIFLCLDSTPGDNIFGPNPKWIQVVIVPVEPAQSQAE